MKLDDYKRYCEALKYLFKGDCPYTGIKCDAFDCANCEVEKQEYQWLEDLTTEGDELEDGKRT